MHVSGINDWLLNLKTVLADYYLISLLISVCTYVHNMKMSSEKFSTNIYNFTVKKSINHLNYVMITGQLYVTFNSFSL